MFRSLTVVRKHPLVSSSVPVRRGVERNATSRTTWEGALIWVLLLMSRPLPREQRRKSELRQNVSSVVNALKSMPVPPALCATAGRLC